MGNCGSQFTDAYCGGLLSEELEAGPDIVGYGVRNQERRLEQTMKLTSPFHRYWRLSPLPRWSRMVQSFSGT